jgi:hypothetical protein
MTKKTRTTMFTKPFRTAPLVADITDVRARMRVNRADSEATRDLDLRLPSFRIY